MTPVPGDDARMGVTMSSRMLEWICRCMFLLAFAIATLE